MKSEYQIGGYSTSMIISVRECNAKVTFARYQKGTPHSIQPMNRYELVQHDLGSSDSSVST